jgi:hypothetical protein
LSASMNATAAPHETITENITAIADKPFYKKIPWAGLGVTLVFVLVCGGLIVAANVRQSS